MNRRKFIRNLAVGSAGVGLTSLPYELLASPDFVTISILHTNDIHCHIEPLTGGDERNNNKGGMARISELVKQTRKENPNTLLFDAGDMFQGTPYFNYFKGELILKVMSSIGYDAGTIGNHEFDNGLKGILDPLPNAKFPLINSNYDFSDTILNGKFSPWKTFTKSGIKIGVYGLGIELKGLVAEKNFGNTVYNDPLKVASQMESLLRNDEKCDLIVCLSHLGYKYNDNKISDVILAENTFYTDLIIGGHTHTFLEKPEILTNRAGEQVIVNQAGCYSLMLGKIDFVFERSGNKKKPVLTANL